MDHFLGYFLPRLTERVPECAAVVEAITEGYKICHPAELGGKVQKRQYGTHHPYAANPLYTVPSGCAEAHGAARSKSQNVRLSHEPLDKSNLGVNISHVATSAFVEANDRKHVGKCQGDKRVLIFSHKELIPAMEAILRSQKFFNKLMHSKDLAPYKNVWVALKLDSRHSSDSAYTYFYPNTDIKPRYDVLRITNHDVTLGNVRPGTVIEVSLQFLTDENSRKLHGTAGVTKTTNGGKTVVQP